MGTPDPVSVPLRMVSGLPHRGRAEAKPTNRRVGNRGGGPCAGGPGRVKGARAGVPDCPAAPPACIPEAPSRGRAAGRPETKRRCYRVCRGPWPGRPSAPRLPFRHRPRPSREVRPARRGTRAVVRPAATPGRLQGALLGTCLPRRAGDPGRWTSSAPREGLPGRALLLEPHSALISPWALRLLLQEFGGSHTRHEGDGRSPHLHYSRRGGAAWSPDVCPSVLGVPAGLRWTAALRVLGTCFSACARHTLSHAHFGGLSGQLDSSLGLVVLAFSFLEVNSNAMPRFPLDPGPAVSWSPGLTTHLS